MEGTEIKMEHKAKKVFTIPGKHSNIVEYEYRGKHYEVEYAKDWTYCVTPAKIQHRDAQTRIDSEIELENKPHGENGFNIDEIFELDW